MTSMNDLGRELQACHDTRKPPDFSELEKALAMVGKQFDTEPHFANVMKKCWEIYNAKGRDYTIANADRLHNFRTEAQLLGITMMQVLHIYFYKHFASFTAYCKTGKVESEGIESRIFDMINYLILAHKIIEEEKNNVK